MNERTDALNKSITVAGILNILGLLFIIVSLFKLTPITLMVSVTFGGILITIALLLYIYVVVRDLKMRKVL
jgi:hypothetical protein